MFNGCSSLVDIKNLQNWDVSKGENFESMFCQCSKSLNIKDIKKWKISKSKFKSLLSEK